MPTAHMMLNAGRLEEIARAFEEADEETQVADIAEVVRLTPIEFAALVGECLASRKMAGIGSGVIATQRGGVETENQKGFYRRMKFKFFLEIGSPVGNVEPDELRALGMKTANVWAAKLMNEIESLIEEIMQRRERDERARIEGKNVRKFLR